MSGGSLNYGYRHMLDLADEIKEKCETEIEHEFANHLIECAKAAKALEWYYSGDTNRSEIAIDLIKVILGKE